MGRFRCFTLALQIFSNAASSSCFSSSRAQSAAVAIVTIFFSSAATVVSTFAPGVSPAPVAALMFELYLSAEI